MTMTRATAAATARPLEVGFMPLLDAAPLLAAVRLGLDRRHGLALRLHRQPSWATLRDRLLTGQLDAAQAMAAMVLGVQTGIGGPQADLAILMGLNRNGQAITLSPPLAAALAQGRSLAGALRALPRRAVFAQTFPTGTHALWLYYWLASLGIDPLHDIQAVSLPPSRMPQALADGELDGFCAGEPWGAEAEALGAGRRVLASGRIWSGHPEKVLATRRGFAALEPELAVALTAAVLEACRWLDADPRHRREAAGWLAEAGVIGLPEPLLAAGLAADAVPAEGLQFHAGGDANYPWISDGRWFLGQFRRWGWLPAGSADADAWLEEVYRTGSYRQAAACVGVPAPQGDTRPGVLFDRRTWG